MEAGRANTARRTGLGTKFLAAPSLPLLQKYQQATTRLGVGQLEYLKAERFLKR